jgi:hypothetical protein
MITLLDQHNTFICFSTPDSNDAECAHQFVKSGLALSGEMVFLQLIALPLICMRNLVIMESIFMIGSLTILSIARYLFSSLSNG